MGVNVTQMGGGGKKIAESTATTVTDVPASNVISAKGLQKGSYDEQSKILLPYADVANAIGIDESIVANGSTVLGIQGNYTGLYSLTTVNNACDNTLDLSGYFGLIVVNESSGTVGISNNHDVTFKYYAVIDLPCKFITRIKRGKYNFSVNKPLTNFKYGTSKYIALHHNFKISFVFDIVNNKIYLGYIGSSVTIEFFKFDL